MAAPLTQPLLELAIQHHRAGNLREAAVAYGRVLQNDPASIAALGNLGLILQAGGQLTEAESLFRKLVELCPSDGRAHMQLGVTLAMQRRFNDALAALRRALVLLPNNPDALNNLGNALRESGEFQEARALCQRAVAVDPRHADAHINLGLALEDSGRLDEAIASVRQALRLRPRDPAAHSNLLLMLNCHEGYDASALHAEHAQFGVQQAGPVAAGVARPPAAAQPDPEKTPLRIGYISADLRSHSVAFFLEKILANHDRDRFTVTCYSNVTKPDAMTRHMQGLVHRWREIAHVSDERAAEMVRGDGIDILVDLSGHTHGNRLLLMARRPAPIQATYLGYPNTTGLKQIDYLITDALVAPGGTEANYAERVVRLPGSFFCYFEPDVGVQPTERTQSTDSGQVTFAVMSTWVKVRPAMMELWARILQATPGSKLLLKAKSLADAALAAEVRRFFIDRGIAADRIDIQGASDFDSYLRLMGQVDIALDTYPSNGHTTTCHTMWMGVPVISRTGNTHPSRMGLSILSSLGLGELAARTPDEYVQIAVNLASDLPRLAELRGGMRRRWQDSGLLDGTQFTRKLEAAYQQMWRERTDTIKT